MQNQADSKYGWYVWIFPAIALAFCLWLFIKYRSERGPLIKINFDDASSLQAEKTRVRFRGVTIGIVKDIEITEDNKDVVVYVALNKNAEHFAVEGTKFWVVSPKVNFQGVTGLETFFAGSYIAVQPGKPGGEYKEEFNGQMNAETFEPIENTTNYILETPNAESVSIGDTVTFRGLPIGSVTKVSLSKTAQLVFVQINIQNRYVKLIRTNTMFWRKAGIQANLGLFKSEIKMNSLDTVLHGGVELFTPDPANEIAKASSHFALNTAPPKDYQKWNPKLEFDK